MAILKFLKNIIGLGDNDADQDIEQQPAALQQPAAVAGAVDTDTPLEASPEMVRMIFARVVEETNRSLPDYLGQSVDPEKQKQYLYDQLDQSLKEYIASLEAAASERCRALWQKDREAQIAETEALKQRARDLEARRAELNEKQLSAERQKRALQERLHDLETKVITLEAEKEQYEIENKGLVNKAKVAAVYETQIKDLQQQIEQMRLSGQSAEEKAAAPDPAVERLRTEVARLEDECTRLRGLSEAAGKENEDLKAQLGKLTESLHTAQVKDEMGGAMLNDLQKKASEALQAAKASEARIAEVEQDSERMLAERECVIADLKKEAQDHLQQIHDQNERIARLQQQVDENAEAGEVMQTIMEQMELFEQVKSGLEERVASLKRQLSDARKENDSLKTTIKNNLYAHGLQEKALQDQIDQLRDAATAHDIQAQAPKPEVMEYPSLFSEGSDGEVPAHASSDARTDDLIADTDWIK